MPVAVEFHIHDYDNAQLHALMHVWHKVQYTHIVFLKILSTLILKHVYHTYVYVYVWIYK